MSLTIGQTCSQHIKLMSIKCTQIKLRLLQPTFQASDATWFPTLWSLNECEHETWTSLSTLNIGRWIYLSTRQWRSIHA